MISSVAPQLTQFALDVAEGLQRSESKKLSPRYLYDELGSALFEAITYLPEYGLTRADENLIRRYASAIAAVTGPIESVAELGSGSGRKSRFVLEAFGRKEDLVYSPIDISAAALSACSKELAEVVSVRPVCADWMQGLSQLAKDRRGNAPMLLLFLGSSIGNLERPELVPFLREIHSCLRPGDYFLIGADLVKDIDTMITAYDDPTGVTAAFNLNLLGRINRELHADFDLRSFAHEARWNAEHRRIEMHLVSGRNQRIRINALDLSIHFTAGETIWTESSHKFSVAELETLARAGGFTQARTWVDQDWPFAECLWRA